MTNEEKQLLLKDLCARLPYGVIVDNPNPAGGAWDTVINIDVSAKTVTLLYNGWVLSIDEIKPYLRPMLSMTIEEREEYDSCKNHICDEYNRYCFDNIKSIDWLNVHHFDYRGLIEKGLALESPEGMYKNE